MDFKTINKHRLCSIDEVRAMIQGISILHRDLQQFEAGAAPEADKMDNTAITIAFKSIFSGPTDRIDLVYGELPTCEDIVKVIKTMFPRAVIQHSTTTTSVGNIPLHHVTVRPDFMQREDTMGFPVMSGSAMCSHPSIAYMQAFVRMVLTELLGYQSYNFAKALTAKKNARMDA